MDLLTKAIRHFMSTSCMPSAILRIMGIARNVRQDPCLGGLGGAM